MVTNTKTTMVFMKKYKQQRYFQEKKKKPVFKIVNKIKFFKKFKSNNFYIKNYGVIIFICV